MATEGGTQITGDWLENVARIDAVLVALKAALVAAGEDSASLTALKEALAAIV